MLIIQRPSVEAIDEEEGNRQRFSISPLEPGFGHTIGNSLRRTLLSSIPGAAITQVRFDDALHEFGTIAGVTEDVTDVILNLKDIVVVSHSDEPVTLRLDVRGAAEVTAGDIQTTADVEILTPDLHLASVNSKGRLAADLTIERGRGYLQADATRGSGTIGVIPVDSIFSPVRRVAFTVEPTRVEQSTNYDRLVLDIETDGSISPREALASSDSIAKKIAPESLAPLPAPAVSVPSPATPSAGRARPVARGSRVFHPRRREAGDRRDYRHAEGFAAQEVERNERPRLAPLAADKTSHRGGCAY